MMTNSNENIKLSFIIPVYNVENYIVECIESIQSQMTAECQLLLVDDGSTDSSAAICDAYAEQDPRIRVFRKQNAGASAARNLGLAHAQGAYIGFVDSDDRIAPGSVARLLSWIAEGGADVCFLEAVKFYADGSMEPMGDGIKGDQLRGKTKAEAVHYIGSRPKYPGSACTKLFRKQFLDAHAMVFPEGHRHAEDLTFVRDCILKAETYDALSMPFYGYRQGREGSVTNTLADKGFWDLLHFVSDSAGELTVDHKPVDACGEYFMSLVAYEYSILLWHYSQLPGPERREGFLALRPYAWVMDFALSRKTRLIGMMIKALGLKATAWMLKQYMNYR